MVTDPDIKKVIMVCDKAYVNKADRRSGGVGTEAQIISGKIYESQTQDKFVAVLKERDSEGKAVLPAYYHSRIYVDLSDPSTYSENFEKLLRWIFDKPLYKKPELGKIPAYLDETPTTRLATTSKFKRATDAVKNTRPYANAAFSEYLTTLAQELEKLRLDNKRKPIDEALEESIAAFLPYRNEAIESFETIALYCNDIETIRIVHRFFESIIPYMWRTPTMNQWSETDFDNYRFIIHELFIYAIAVFIKSERFDFAQHIMSELYYADNLSGYGNSEMVPYEIFYQHTASLENRSNGPNGSQKSNRLQTLLQRCNGLGLEPRHIMQADLVLYVRDCIQRPDVQCNWYPITLYSRTFNRGVFEVFARAQAKSYFDRMKALLGIQRKEDLLPFIDTFKNQTNSFTNIHRINPTSMIGFEKLATIP